MWRIVYLWVGWTLANAFNSYIMLWLAFISIMVVINIEAMKYIQKDEVRL